MDNEYQYGTSDNPRRGGCGSNGVKDLEAHLRNLEFSIFYPGTKQVDDAATNTARQAYILKHLPFVILEASLNKYRIVTSRNPLMVEYTLERPDTLEPLAADEMMSLYCAARYLDTTLPRLRQYETARSKGLLVSKVMELETLRWR